ncbi:hypothetical protein P8625_07330 [Tenacibaculum tangerinum]|uniref:Uncharacterized protein n=1 Tax=Tenacibaculum tangerinum TaxID=3038772 RepID=A0ABY8L6C6_9FLAO|nr:hypothetical protein [Tenacibaculum tangerinum]WGH76947.1 hypothetical protein P8625_07330 [Tenacibaculum tangerinum]
MSRKLVHIAVLISFLFGVLTLNAQNLSDIPKTGLIKLMVDSFENQICSYYSIEKENSNEAFFKYVNDFRANNINFKEITSKEELELLEVSNKTLKDYIWITNKEKNERFFKNYEEENQIQIIEVNDSREKNTKEPLHTNEVSVNYFDEYSNKLLEETKVKDLKEILATLKEMPDTSPYTTSFSFTYLNKESYNDSSLKTFIAFELYYTVLNILNKNE